MEQVFKEHQLCKLHGPFGPYFDSYATEMCREGYAQQTREVQIRVVAAQATSYSHFSKTSYQDYAGRLLEQI